MRVKAVSTLVLLGCVVSGGATLAQDPRPGEPGYIPPPISSAITASHFGSSPFNPPEANDSTFVVDQDRGLDTGCTFRSGGPLVFSIKINRVVGDVQRLKNNKMISETAVVRMPAFDVDFDAVVPGYAPERDRVTFNGRVVPTEFLTGSNNVWKLNAFEVPIEWVNFADDPGKGNASTEKDNIVRIDIDTANSEEAWCTSIDWASLSIEVARPVVLVHGIFRGLFGDPWTSRWVPGLTGLGLPNTSELNMGDLGGISRNAGMIANVVAASKQRWGVDKVNLVCHSKGGIDSRHFVENSSDVEQVIQLGTPNAGSPLADYVQGTSVALIGRIPTWIVNALAGPAGKQLTQRSMLEYNRHHGSNPEVRYTALAGNYDPACRFGILCPHPIDAFLVAITGRGDSIVPLSSVFALGYTRNLIFNTQGSDNEAIHTKLTTAQRVFNGVKDRVMAVGASTPIADTSRPVAVPHTAIPGSPITQGETRIQEIPVDTTGPVFFTLFYPSGDLDLTLISPSGQRFDPAVPASETVTHEEADILGGRMEAYAFSVAEAGTWTAEVRAASVTDTIVYAVDAWLPESPIVFSGQAAPAAVHAGEVLTLTGTVLETGAPVPGAEVVATIALPDDTTRQVSLLDNGSGADLIAGDGIYSAQFAETSQPGDYRIQFRATGTGLAPTPSFSRGDFDLATVSRSSSSFAGTYRDSGIDTDGDGLFNQLLVEVDLSITHAGTYRVFGVLTDSAGNTHQAHVVSVFDSGPAVATLRFDGKALFQNGVDGPYRLSVIRMAEEDEVALLPVAEAIDVHQTGAYSYRQFQHPPLLLTGGGSAVGVDTNGNGLFDLLNVAVDVEVDFAGFYNWSARLLDADGNELGFAAQSGFFSAGRNSIRLTYAGQPIGRNGADGPYFVTDLLLFGAGQSLVAPQVFTTSPFLANQFEGYVEEGNAPTLSVSLSPSLLWPPNHQMVEIEADIQVQDDVDPHPEVRLVSITSNEPDEGLGDGDSANDIQGTETGIDDRTFQLRAERSGTGTGRTYTVTYEARDSGGNVRTVITTVVVPRERSR
jgi:hypothetical protein